MRLHSLAVLTASIAATFTVASPTPSQFSNHVVHEKRSQAPSGWTKRERVEGDAPFPLRIGLRQRNLERGHEFLDSVSNPKSSSFGQHWTPDEVVDMFSPSDDSISEVKSWLTAFGIEAGRISLSKSKSWITVDTTITEAEELLQAKYHIYEHSLGQAHVACDSYSVPSLLSQNHIDIIMPTVHFDAKVIPGRMGSGDHLRKRQVEKRKGMATDIGTNSGSLPKLGKAIGPSALVTGLTNCDTIITPECLRALYSFGEGTLASSQNSYGIVEYTPQAYRAADLDMFFKNFSTAQVGKRPILASVDGGVVQQIVASFSYNGESDLDLEYAMALVYPQNVTLYQVGDLQMGASFNNFLDGIDASYCTYDGGDDPDYDGTYPDPLSGGYKKQDCGLYTAANVISTSYGYNEADLTPAYEVRQCYEYMKLGLQGVTVLYSSGDYGVGGNGGQCINADGSYNSGTSGRFNPSFPGGCPYVTSVGATQVPTGTDIVSALASGTQPETACETVIYSGGGFSNVFAMPSYQADAVTSFLTDYPPPYGSDRYNNSGVARAFPDVSANGANYVVAVDNSFGLVYGTSASAPTFGSVVTLINEQRIAAGKTVVGFLNPVLYANPDVLIDVTVGGNQGCGTAGFSSQPGWDPVTGLGTPNYEKMLELYLSLP